MKKKTTKLKSKAVTGRNRNNNGFTLTRRGALVGLVAIVAFSVAAGLGWKQWQETQSSAGAWNFSFYTDSGSAVYWVCTTSLGKGNYAVRGKITNNSNSTLTNYVRFMRPRFGVTALYPQLLNITPHSTSGVISNTVSSPYGRPLLYPSNTYLRDC